MPTVTHHKVRAEEGERADFPRLGNRYLLRGDRSKGRFALIEHTIAPRSLAAPTHTHEREDEYSFVLTGRLGAQIGDEVVEAGPGELVLKPRGIPHAFWNPGDEETRVLEIISPAGFEQYFADVAPELAGPGEPDFATLAEIRARYELTMDIASREPLIKQHGLEAYRPATVGSDGFSRVERRRTGGCDGSRS
jgi:mannose-6-phosphate isomerase-like protein (cupin superfamily)